MKSIVRRVMVFSLVALAGWLLAGCASAPGPVSTVMPPATPPPMASNPIPDTPAPAAATPAVPAVATPAVPPVEMPAFKPVRIKAGASDAYTDTSGNVWLADQGFADGDTTERPDVTIVGASDPHIYQSERYSMSSFTWPLPDGKYIVKLHFCETYDGITGPGQRVFSFNVAGQDFKDFDVWVKSGGALHAYVETVPVEITNGKLEITFTPNIENPQINGIEILPAM